MDTQKDPEMYVRRNHSYTAPLPPTAFSLFGQFSENHGLTQPPCNSISGPMTGALVVYAATFMRYSLAVTPKNYLLFACHLTNFGAQTTQAYRYLNYWKCVPRISTPVYTPFCSRR